MDNKKAIGMFTVHKEVQQDMKGTFIQLYEMGYRGIEFYGEPEYDIAAVKGAITVSGLELTSWHIEWRDLQPDRFDKTVDYLKEIGCSTAVVPCLGGKWNIGHSPDKESREIWLGYIAWLNETDKKLKAHGIRMGYHNHEHEFMLKYDGKPVFDMLFENLAQDIIMEFDTGNCIEGGADPVKVINKYKGRDMLLHLKPFSKTSGFDTVLGAEDDLNDWKAILSASESDYLWLIIESECAVLGGFENAQKCIDGLNRVI